MIIKQKIDHCSLCDNYTEYNYGIDDYDPHNHNLENYNKYKDIFVSMCVNCGFISTDISEDLDSDFDFDDFIDSDKFKEILSYKYLEGYNTMLDENHARSIPANIYELYSIECEEVSEYEMSLRALNSTIEQKLMMLEKYRVDTDFDDEEEIEIFNNLEHRLTKNIISNEKHLLEIYSKITHKNLFVKLIYIENLLRLSRKEEAEELFNQIIEENQIADDLKEYFIKL